MANTIQTCRRTGKVVSCSLSADAARAAFARRTGSSTTRSTSNSKEMARPRQVQQVPRSSTTIPHQQTVPQKVPASTATANTSHTNNEPPQRPSISQHQAAPQRAPQRKIAKKMPRQQSKKNKRKDREKSDNPDSPPLLKQIKKLQKQPENVLQKAPFTKLIRELMHEGDPDSRITAEALEAIQIDTEAFLTSVLEDANLAAIHRDRITVLPKDVDLIIKVNPAYKILGEPDVSMEVEKSYRDKDAFQSKPDGWYAESDEVTGWKRLCKETCKKPGVSRAGARAGAKTSGPNSKENETEGEEGDEEDSEYENGDKQDEESGDDDEGEAQDKDSNHEGEEDIENESMEKDKDSDEGEEEGGDTDAGGEENDGEGDDENRDGDVDGNDDED